METTLKYGILKWEEFRYINKFESQIGKNSFILIWLSLKWGKFIWSMESLYII